MSKATFISIIAGGLLLSNLLLAGFIVLRAPRPERHKQPREIIIERLHLDEGQTAAYGQLIQWHRSHIREADRQIMMLKNRLYRTLNEPAGQQEKDSLIKELGRMQMRIEQVNYQHFSDIRKICRDDQLKDYEALTTEIARLFAPPPPPEKAHP